MPKKKVKRTCWNCDHKLCYLKRRMDELLSASSNMLNIDGDAAPGRCYEDLHAALGECCFLYKENPDAD